jgi:hypothetical protein
MNFNEKEYQAWKKTLYSSKNVAICKSIYIVNLPNTPNPNNPPNYSEKPQKKKNLKTKKK